MYLQISWFAEAAESSSQVAAHGRRCGTASIRQLDKNQMKIKTKQIAFFALD